jgi:DNA helicase IV
LLKASSLFIQKNPAQLKKQLSANRPGTHRAIYLLEYDENDGPDASLRAHRAAMKDYSKRFSPAKPDILFLSRYRRGVEAIEKDVLPGLKNPGVARNLTVHRSKGLEADCVILSEARGGRMGFPCAREDDPMIRRVLTDPDEFPHAEERRLFYVALTRAKTCVYIVAPAGTRSVFVSELLEDFASDSAAQLMVALSSADAKKVHRCPVCRGHLVARDASGETFWSCENSPACYFTTQECSGCKKSPLLPHPQKTARLHCATCGDSTVDTCPRCKVGSLVRRIRRADSKPFWACSFFAKTGCSFTTD